VVPSEVGTVVPLSVGQPAPADPAKVFSDAHDRVEQVEDSVANGAVEGALGGKAAPMVSVPPDPGVIADPVPRIIPGGSTGFPVVDVPTAAGCAGDDRWSALASGAARHRPGLSHQTQPAPDRASADRPDPIRGRVAPGRPGLGLPLDSCAAALRQAVTRSSNRRVSSRWAMAPRLDSPNRDCIDTAGCLGC
jgi:hypothetical protein